MQKPPCTGPVRPNGTGKQCTPAPAPVRAGMCACYAKWTEKSSPLFPVLCMIISAKADVAARTGGHPRHNALGGREDNSLHLRGCIAMVRSMVRVVSGVFNVHPLSECSFAKSNCG